MARSTSRRDPDADERAEYERLRAKFRRSRPTTPTPPVEDDGDDGDIVIISGKRGDRFLDRLFGEGSSATGGDAGDGDPDDDGDQDDDDDDDDDDDGGEDQDPPTSRGHRYFGGRQ